MSSKKPIFWNRSKPIHDRLLCAPVLMLLFAYKRFVSPMLGNACRFYPSCSDYAREAFWRKNFWSALALAAWRLARCNPLHPGGYDPLEAPPADAENGKSHDAPSAPRPGETRNNG